MRAKSIVGMLVAALCCLGLFVPAPVQASDDPIVTWPATTRLGNESVYFYDVHYNAEGFLQYLSEAGAWTPVADPNGRNSVRFHQPGDHQVLIRLCGVAETCTLVATSPTVEVYDEARVTGVITQASMGPNSRKDVTISIEKPAGWDHVYVAWKLSRTATSTVVASGSVTAQNDGAGNGTFLLRVPSTLPTAKYLLRLHLLVHDPDGPSLPTDTQVKIVWERTSTGTFGWTPKVIYPRRAQPTRFAGAVTTAWSSELKRAAAVVLDAKGRPVRSLPVVFDSFGHRIKVAWNGRINGRVRVGSYVVRVTWLDWAANRGKAQRLVKVSGSR